MPQLLGAPPRVVHIEYKNPFELILLASGFALTGILKVCRFARDYSAQKRIANAQATAAEAHADLHVTRADTARWLLQEAQQGRVHVPPADMLSVVTAEDMAAIQRLADSEIQLQMPPERTPTHRRHLLEGPPARRSTREGAPSPRGRQMMCSI